MGQRSISISIPVFAYQIHALTSDNFGWFLIGTIPNENITIRRLIFLRFPSFSFEKGNRIFLFRKVFRNFCIFFFFFNIPDFSPSSSRWRRKEEKKDKNSKNFNFDNLHGLKYYSRDTPFIKFQLSNSNSCSAAIRDRTGR